MIQINVEFQEKYKQLDALCKDIFLSKEGVSVYINEMENTSFEFRKYAYDWEDTYKRLKHMRWVRNQLAHEVGAFNTDLCTEFDLKWLTYFYNSILNRTDPLAKVGQVQRNLQSQQSYSNTCKKSTESDTKISFWDRIKAKFKSWLS